jgi:hypothetical protein
VQSTKTLRRFVHSRVNWTAACALSSTIWRHRLTSKLRKLLSASTLGSKTLHIPVRRTIDQGSVRHRRRPCRALGRVRQGCCPPSRPTRAQSVQPPRSSIYKPKLRLRPGEVNVAQRIQAQLPDTLQGFPVFLLQLEKRPLQRGMQQQLPLQQHMRQQRLRLQGAGAPATAWCTQRSSRQVDRRLRSSLHANTPAPTLTEFAPATLPRRCL